MKKLIHNTINEYVNHLQGGKGDTLTREDVDQKQLQLGIYTEMEHTDNPEVAEEIALDHLADNPDYYTILMDSGLIDEPEAIQYYKDVFGDLEGISEYGGRNDRTDGGRPPINRGRGFGGFTGSMGQHIIDKENREYGRILNRKTYWEQVADELSAELVSFDVEYEEYEQDDSGQREIVFELSDGSIFALSHDWRHDGTSTKPVTTIEIEDRDIYKELGRFSIWPESEKYAEDLLDVIK